MSRSGKLRWNLFVRTKLSMEKDLYGIQRSWEGVSVAVPQTRDGRGAECCGMNERN